MTFTKFSPILLCLLCIEAHGAIIGNIPLKDMKRRAVLIVSGTVQDVKNASDGSVWTIQVMKTYQGAEVAVVSASTDRPVTQREMNGLRSEGGIFMIGSDGKLLNRTGSIVLTDRYVPLPNTLSSAKNIDVALCVDWMRGLTSPNVDLIRDLAVAAADCGSTKELVDGIRFELGGSPKNVDALVVILTGMAYSDPSALQALEEWLRNNPDPSSRLAENIGWGLFAYLSPDADGSFALRRLALGARSPRIRECAASVLAYIHAEETWSDLAALLDSSDRRVRWLALNGLQQAVDGGERGEPGAFERQLMHLGKPVPRNTKKRPPIPASARVPAAQASDDAALLQFWREYAARNR
jgi:hypothetical protein